MLLKEYGRISLVPHAPVFALNNQAANLKTQA